MCHTFYLQFLLHILSTSSLADMFFYARSLKQISRVASTATATAAAIADATAAATAADTATVTTAKATATAAASANTAKFDYAF